LKFVIISYVNSLERRKHVLLPVKHSLHTRISLLYYSYIPWPTKWTYSVKRLRMCEVICERKSTCMTQTQILTKTTQIWGFSKLRLKIKKKCYIDLLHFSIRTCMYNVLVCVMTCFIVLYLIYEILFCMSVWKALESLYCTVIKCTNFK
jgi:hypothetical protein